MGYCSVTVQVADEAPREVFRTTSDDNDDCREANRYADGFVAGLICGIGLKPHVPVRVYYNEHYHDGRIHTTDEIVPKEGAHYGR